MSEETNNIKLLQQELEKLKSENKKLDTQLIQISKKLAESEEFKSNFFSNITNEIINPFTSIISISESILLAEKEDWKKTYSLIALIHNEAINLDILLKNFLCAAQIEAGEISMDYCKINMIELLYNIKDRFKYLIKKKHIEIDLLFDIPNQEKQLYFNSDPEKLKTIITNFLYLAIEYSFENKKIEINTSIKNKILELEFKDYSSGISSQYHKLIFDKFNGINKVSKIGTYHQGFGLIVSRSLLEIMGGYIKLDEKQKQDEIFTINIPESSGELTGVSESGDEIIF